MLLRRLPWLPWLRCILLHAVVRVIRRTRLLVRLT